jgi:hypothetical protein
MWPGCLAKPRLVRRQSHTRYLWVTLGAAARAVNGNTDVLAER